MNSVIDKKDILINVVLFQVLWFVAILGQGLWALIPLAFMFIHLVLMRNKQTQCVLVLLVLASIGIVFDSIYHYMGLYQFSSESLTLAYLNLPIWLACLWIGFCLTLPVSLAWLVKKPYLFILACSLLGPISYLAGRRLGGLEFSNSNLWLLALEWCVFSIIALIFLFPKLAVLDSSPVFLKKESSC